MILKNVFYNGANYSGYSVSELKGIGVPDTVISDAKSEQELAIVKEARILAYAEESDGLYMEWQFDQTAESENAWRDKVQEIKNRYPLIV